MTRHRPQASTSSGRARRPLASIDPILEVAFRAADGSEHTVAAARARGVAFECCLPMRTFTHRRDQYHTPGSYWSATLGDLVECESYLERQWMTLLDFDPEVTAFSGQPLTFHGADPHGRWHATPDIFARLADGSARLLEVKNPEQINDEKVLRTAERVAAACAQLGWGYRLVGALDPQRWANISLLHGFRRPLGAAGAALIGQILAVTARAVSFDELFAFIQPAELAKPVVFHLLWHGRLTCDLDAPLRGTTVLRLPNGKEQ